MDVIRDRNMVWRCGPGGDPASDQTEHRGGDWRSEPTEQRLFGQTGYFRWQQRIQRMAKDMGIGSFNVKLVVMIQVDPGMRHMEFTTATNVVRMGVKGRANKVKGHEQEQQPTANQRPPGSAMWIDT